MIKLVTIKFYKAKSSGLVHALCILLFLGIVCELRAQNFLSNYDPTMGPGGTVISALSPDLDFEGHPFLEDKWLPAIIYSNSGIKVEVEKAKYDAVNGNLFVIEDGDTLFVNNLLVRKFSISNPDGSITEFQNRIGRVRGEIDIRTFLKVYHQGNAGLYSNYRKVIRGMYQERTGYEAQIPRPSFQEMEDFYFRNLEGNLVPVRLRERNVLALFDSYEDAISEYVSINELNLRNPSDVVKAIQKYESLVFNISSERENS